MRTPDTRYVTSVLAANEAPCVSIYLPTVRGRGAENAARFRALARKCDGPLGAHLGGAAVAAKLHELADDQLFWSDALESAVVLASPARCDAFALPRAVPERAEVGETFHVKPLLRYAQSAEPFHVLGVSHARAALFYGHRYVLTPLAVPGVPLTPADVPAARATHGDGAHEPEPDVHRFFRAVDHEVARRASEPSGLPLLLMGTDDNLGEFRRVAKNRFVSPDAVRGDWTHWSLNEIREHAWAAFEKHYLDRLARTRNDFGSAAGRGRASANLEEAARAAAEGRAGVLLIYADRTVPGSIALGTGALHPDAGAAAGDMLDDLAEMGLKADALVLVVPSDQMPTDTGLAAIFRYYVAQRSAPFFATHSNRAERDRRCVTTATRSAAPR
jgi:hypothetical protein